MGITIKSKGDWNNTFSFFKKSSNLSNTAKRVLQRAAEDGLKALQDNTPVRTGLLASSWDYKIEYGNTKSIITWYTHDMEGGENVAILVQYGHATKGGTYVQGRDFINPALQPIFDNFVNELWKEVIEA